MTECESGGPRGNGREDCSGWLKQGLVSGFRSKLKSEYIQKNTKMSCLQLTMIVHGIRREWN